MLHRLRYHVFTATAFLIPWPGKIMATPGYTIMPNELHKIVKKYTE